MIKYCIVGLFAFCISCTSSTAHKLLMPDSPGYDCAKIWAEASVDLNNGRMAEALNLYQSLLDCDKSTSDSLPNMYPYVYYDIIRCYSVLNNLDSMTYIRRLAKRAGYAYLISCLDSLLPIKGKKYIDSIDSYIPYPNDPVIEEVDSYIGDPFPVVLPEGIKNLLFYPYEADSMSLEGRVYLKIFFDDTGNIIYTNITRIEGSYLFAAATSYAVNRAKWIMPVVQGHTYGGNITLPFTFKKR